jgi:uncharacterized protein
MSQENVEIVRRGFDAYERGDVDAAMTDVASDCEYVPSGALPWGRGVYRGPEGFKRYIGRLRDVFEDTHVGVKDVVDAGNQVLVSLPNVTRLRGRDGVATVARSALVYELRDGLVTRVCLYQDTREALEAVGLSE